VSARLAIIALTLAAFVTVGHAQRGAPYTTVFYTSGALRIEAYLYKPPGEGVFPLIIYNHGNRSGGLERTEQPHVAISALLTDAGFAVFVPERRGFGKSDGATFANDGTQDPDGTIRRVEREADDVLAALDYLKTQPFIDVRRIGMIGYSLGGQVAVFAASRSDTFRVIVDQAGGSLAWDRSAVLQRTLPQTASTIKAPTLCMVAANDATTAAVTRVCDAIKARGGTAETIIYPPFTPSAPVGNTPPGHLLFTTEGIPIWGKETVGFVSKYLRPKT
jgi:dienelactone hydrolase